MIKITFSKNDIKLDVAFDLEKNTIWMSQNEMAILFNRKVPAISKQLTKIRDYIAEYPSVVSKMENTGVDGKSYQMKMKISVRLLEED